MFIELFAALNYLFEIFHSTDSVFLKFPKVEGETPLQARQRTLKLAQEMEEKINNDGTFVKPNYLEQVFYKK